MRTDHRPARPGSAPLSAPPWLLTRLLALLAALLAAVVAGPSVAVAVPRPIPLVTVGLGVPAPPEPVAEPNFASVKLSWAPVAQGGAPVLRYTVFRGLSGLTMLPYAEVEAPAPGGTDPVTYVDRKTDPGVTYQYAVTAINAIGPSVPSRTVAAAPTPVGVVFATAKWTGRDDAYDLALLSGGVVTKINTDDGDHQTPAVAPDGSAIAYTSNHGNGPGDYDLWLQRPGADPVRLTSGPEADAEPSFSPDGSLIAFSRLFKGFPRVWVVPAQGGEAWPVPNTNGEGQPSWSPNGRLLAVAHVTGTISRIVLTNLDGTYRRTVPGTSSAEFPAFDPSFSPDGTTLSFVLSNPKGSSVATVPVTGGTPAILTPGTLAVGAQQWAPGGERIVFEGYSENTPGTMWSVDPASGLVAQEPGSAVEAGLSPTPAEAPAPYTPIAVPGMPLKLTGALGARAVTLRWAAPVGEPQEGAWYIVRRSSPGGVAPARPEDGEAVYSGPATSARAGKLDDGLRYAFAVFAVSAVGDVGPAAVRAAAPATAPLVRPAGTVLTTSTGGSPSFVATWGGGLGTGQTYEVQVGTRRFDRSAQTWSAPVYRPLSSGTATSAVVPAVAGATYHLRARVRDADGNATPWGAARPATVPYDDRAMTATGDWSDKAGQAGHVGGTLRTSKSPGSSLGLRAWGSAFSLLADRCPSCGAVEIWVDGVKVATVDTYAKVVGRSQVVWSTTFERIRRHTITVVVVGAAGERASRPGAAERRAVKVDGMTARR